MKFKFGLQTLLKHRGYIEQDAKREHSQAQAVLQSCLNLIRQMYDSIDETRRQIADLQSESKPGHIEHIRHMEEYIKGTQVRIQRERMKARELMQNVEVALEKLIEASRDRKILDRLKEKRFLEFKSKIKKAEEKSLDEIVTMRFKKRGA